MNKKLQKIINFLIYATIFIVPLYFSLFYKTFSTFSLDKVVIFLILTELIVLLTVLKIFVNGAITISINKKYIFLMLPFFLAIVVSVIFSIDRHTSFWGSYWRHVGLFAYLHLFAFFIILIVNIKKRNQIEKIIDYILASSFFVSIVGIVQWTGLDIFPWHEKIKLGGRVFSTIGQPVFLGSYLLLTIFLSVYKIITQRKFNRFLFSVIFLSQLACLFFTYTRGAWLGFIFGLFLILTVLLATKVKRRVIVASMVFIALIFLLIFFNSPNFSKRIKSFVDINSGSVALRIKYWDAGLDIIKDRLAFGHGLDTQKQLIVKYYKPDWGVYEDINTSPDRTHNEFLDMIIIGGLFLFLSYFVIIFTIIFSSLRFMRSNAGKNDKILIYLALIGFLSYNVAIFFSFSVIETNILFFVYLFIFFFLLGLSPNKQRPQNFHSSNECRYILRKFCVKINKHLAFVCLFVSIPAILYLIYININNVRADVYFKKSRIAYSEENYNKMYENYKKVLELNKREEFYNRFFISDAIDLTYKPEFSKNRDEILRYAIETVERDKNKNITYSLALKHAKIFTALGYFDEADTLYKRASEISPFMSDVYVAHGSMYAQAKNYKEAIILYNKALSILPKLDSKYLNNEHKKKIEDFMVKIYNNMAYSYFSIGDKKNLLGTLNKIIKIEPENIDAKMKIKALNYE